MPCAKYKMGFSNILFHADDSDSNSFGTCPQKRRLRGRQHELYDERNGMDTRTITRRTFNGSSFNFLDCPTGLLETGLSHRRFMWRFLQTFVQRIMLVAPFANG